MTSIYCHNQYFGWALYKRYSKIEDYIGLQSSDFLIAIQQRIINYLKTHKRQITRVCTRVKPLKQRRYKQIVEYGRGQILSILL